MEHKTFCIPFYKTGYCKYGNECKYLHIRTFTQDEHDLCPICCRNILNPVYTYCEHSYCKDCVLQNDDLEKCLICGSDLFGAFNYKK